MDYKYNTHLFDFEFINKFHLNYTININKIDKMDLIFSIRNAQTDHAFFYSKALTILELIGSKKPFVQQYKTNLRDHGTKKSVFVAKISFRKKNLYNFFFLFIFYVLPELNKRFVVFNKIIRNTIFYFSFRDILVFPGFEEKFLNWNYPVYLYFNFKKQNFLNKSFILNFFFRNLTLNFKTF